MDNRYFSIVIPARDEAAYLDRCIGAIKSAAERASSDYEIIVVNNRSADRTAEIALAHGCTVIDDDNRNLAKIRNTGVRAAQGEVLVTIDADSIMSPGMLQAVQKVMEGGQAIGGAVAMLPERWSVGIVCTALCLVPIVIRHGISGGMFFCKREDFNKIGGFDERLCSVEDIDFAKRLKALGKTEKKRFKIILREHLITSCRKFDKLGDWYFLKHPKLFLTLLQGRDQKLADKIWYDFEH